MGADLHALLRSRRSVRRFKPEPVGEQVIERMIASAASAPSAHNRQPWRFYVARRAETKTRLADAMGAEFRRDLLADGLAPVEVEKRARQSRARICSAPLVIVLCMDLSEMDAYPDERRTQAERLMAIQSTAAAGTQLLLAAHAEGLAGVWTCGPLFAPEDVARALELHPAWEPQAMFFIGQPDQEPRPKEMKPLAEIVRWD